MYSIEATCHAPDKVGVYSEIFRVLKPGGLYATYEWVVTEDFDETNPEHVKIKKGALASSIGAALAPYHSTLAHVAYTR